MYKNYFMQTITKEYFKKSGIYCILNLVNQKKYIGSSKNLQERLINHKCQLLKNKHGNKILQNSWNKYYKDNFVYIILEYCEKEKLIEREQFYIDNLNPEFNIVKEVLQHSSFGKKIHQYNLNGDYIKSYNYIIDACKENNIHQSTICRFLNGTYNKGGNFLWSLDYVEKMKPYKKDLSNVNYFKKQVELIDCNTFEIIKTFNSFKECAKYLNCYQNEISKGIKNNRKFKKKYFIRLKQATLNSDV